MSPTSDPNVANLPIVYCSTRRHTLACDTRVLASDHRVEMFSMRPILRQPPCRASSSPANLFWFSLAHKTFGWHCLVDLAIMSTNLVAKQLWDTFYGRLTTMPSSSSSSSDHILLLFWLYFTDVWLTHSLATTLSCFVSL